MKNEKRGSPLAGLTIAAILLASTAGYVSALSRMFQSPVPFVEEETGFHFDEIDAMRSAEVRAVATSEGSFDRTAPAWLVNALPSYSSGRAREMWYLSLESSGDRRLSFESYGGVNDASNPYTPIKTSFASAFVQSTGERFSSTGGVGSAAPLASGSWNSDSSGNWSDTTKWSGGIVADGAASTGNFTFNITATRTITIDTTPRTLGIMNIGDSTGGPSNYTIAASGGGTLTFDNSGSNAQLNEISTSGNNTISAPILLNSPLDITNASANNLTLSGAISANTAGTKTITTSTGLVTISGAVTDGSGPVAITQNGPGTLALTNGANTYSGDTTINGGTITLDTDSEPGTGTLKLSGGTLAIVNDRAAAEAVTNNIVVSANSSIADTVTTNSLNVNFTGTLTGTGGTLSILNSGADAATDTFTVRLSGGTYAMSRPIFINGSLGKVAITEFNTAGTTHTYDGIISGNGSWSRSATTAGTGGETIFNAANTFSGGVTLTDGTIGLGDNSALGTGTLTINGAGSRITSLYASGGSRVIGNAIVFNTGASTSTTVIKGPNDLQLSGTIDLAGATRTFQIDNSVTTLSGNISSATPSTGLTKTGSGILLLTGANNYTGDTSIKAGELEVTGSGSLNSTGTIHLGDTATNSPSAMFTFGNSAGGMTIGNPMIVEASASGTEGTRTILGLAENGASNVYSGVVTMNTNLVVQSAALGSTVANGVGNLIFSGGSIDVKNHTFEMNSNLRGNNADTYSIQGNVTVNEVLGSSLATGGTLVKDGSGSMILQGTTNNYTGTDPGNLNPNGTQIRGGILGIFGDGSLGLAPTNATNNIFFTSSAYNTNFDSIAPTLRANAAGITLAPTRSINIASGVTGQFNSNGVTFTIAGNINGAGNLTKIGPGTLALTGANTYTGTTTINAGTLDAATANALGSTSNVTVNSGGTLLFSNSGTIDRINNNASISLNGQSSATASMNTAGLSEYTVGSVLPGMGALTLQSSSIIDLSNGASIIAFANSALQSWTVGATLSIYNWSGNVLTGNGTDQLYFGTDATGLTVAQLSQISFYSDSGSTFLGVGSWGTDLDGEVVPLAPVPEPSTWIGAALVLAAIGWTQRKRFAKRSRVIG